MEQHIRHNSRGDQELKRIFQHASLFIEPDAKLAQSGDFLILILLRLFVRIANKMSYKTLLKCACIYEMRKINSYRANSLDLKHNYRNNTEVSFAEEFSKLSLVSMENSI